MVKVDLKMIAGIITVILIIAGATIMWQITKEYTTLSREGVTLATHKWHVEAERTYINKNSAYRTNIMCPRIIAAGGHETATRCYYAPETYEQMSRSIINTYLSNTDYTAQRMTPFYAYGTSGSYAGNLIEDWEFIDTESETEFPKTYKVSWSPKDTRSYKLVWRVWDLKDQPLPDGNYTQCNYYARNVQIKLENNCKQLERAEVKGDRIWFYFKPYPGQQVLTPNMQDPAASCTIYVDGSSSDSKLEIFDYPGGVNITAVCTGGTSNACIQAFHPDFRDRLCDTGTKYLNWTTVRSGETRWNDTRTTKSWVFGVGWTIYGYLKPMHYTAEYITKEVYLTGTAYGGSWIRDVQFDWDGNTTYEEMYNGELHGTTWIEDLFYDSTDSAFFDKETYDLDFSDSAAETITLKSTISADVDSASFNLTTTALDDPTEEYHSESLDWLVLDECGAYDKTTDAMYVFGGKNYDTLGLNDSVKWVIGDTVTLTDLTAPSSAIGIGCKAVHDPDDADLILVFGGWDGVSAVNNYVRTYNITGDAWLSDDTMTTSLAYQACDVRPGTDQIYCFGGTNGAGTAQTTAGYWDISAGTWTARTALPSARFSAQIEWYNSSHAIIWGGGSNNMGNTEIYNAVANTYSTPTTATIGRKYVVGSKVGDDIFSYAGQDNTTLATQKKDIFKWDNTNQEWDDTNYNTDHEFSRGHCDEYKDDSGNGVNAYCIGTDDGNVGFDWHLFYHFPSDLSVFIYGQSAASLTVSGPVVGTYETGDIADAINTAVANCPEYSTNGWECYIPVYISATGGTVTVQNLTQNIDHPEAYNLTTLLDPTCGSGYCDANKIRVYSAQQGNLTWTNLTLLWKGYSSLQFNGSSDGDGGSYTAGEDTIDIGIYESRATNTLPYDFTDAIIFLPKTNESKNVTASGWNIATGLINTTGYKNIQTMSLALKLSEALPSCMELYADDDLTKAGATNLNTTYQRVTTLGSPTYTKYTSFWLDLNCNNSQRYVTVDIIRGECCSTCKACW